MRLILLLFGNIRIKQIVLSGADILLETRADGVGNWNLQPSAKDKTDPGTVPTNQTFDKVLIKNSVLVWRDRRTGEPATKIYKNKSLAHQSGGRHRTSEAGSQGKLQWQTR